MRWLALVVLAVLASAASSAPAQESGPRPITLAEAVALAQQNAPQVVQAEGARRTGEADVRSAYAAFLPSVSLSAGATRQYGGRTRIENGQVVTLASEPWSSNVGLSANVAIFQGGQRLFDVREARARVEAAEANLVAQRYAAILAVKQEFFNVIAARESEEAARAQLEQAEQQLRNSVARVRARIATRSDSLRAEIQLRTAQLAILDVGNAIRLADASLTRVVGTPYMVTAAPVDTLERPTIALDDTTLAHLAENGPLFEEARESLSAARAVRRGAWTDYLPSLTVGYSRSGSGSGGGPELAGDDFTYSGSLRFTLSLPLFDQLQRESQIVRADVAEENAEAALRDARLAAREGVVQWIGTYRSAEARVASQAATVEAAEEDLRVQQQRYAVGGSTLLDVLTSQTQLDQARRDLIRARYDQRVAKAQLEALVGREL